MAKMPIDGTAPESCRCSRPRMARQARPAASTFRPSRHLAARHPTPRRLPSAFRRLPAPLLPRRPAPPLMVSAFSSRPMPMKFLTLVRGRPWILSKPLTVAPLSVVTRRIYPYRRQPVALIQVAGDIPSILLGDNDPEFQDLAEPVQAHHAVGRALPHYQHQIHYPPPLVMALSSRIKL